MRKAHLSRNLVKMASQTKYRAYLSHASSTKLKIYWRHINWSVVSAIASAIAAIASCYIALEFGLVQTRIQSEAARTQQIGWLSPRPVFSANTMIRTTKFNPDSFVVEGNDIVQPVHVAGYVECDFYLINTTEVPVHVVMTAFRETRERDLLLWDELEGVLGGEVKPNDWSTPSKMIEPGDSIQVDASFTITRLDSNGWGAGQIMCIVQSPFRRFSVTYIWTRFHSFLPDMVKALNSVRLPVADSINFRALPSKVEWTDYQYFVLNDEMETRLSNVLEAAVSEPEYQRKVDSLETKAGPPQRNQLRILFGSE